MDLDHRRTAVAIDDLLRHPLTRRRALQGAAAVGLSTVALDQFVVRETIAADAKTLVVASGADAVTLDPQVSFDGQSPLLWRAVYENLIKYEGDTLDIVPNLAESYEISEGRAHATPSRSDRNHLHGRCAVGRGRRETLG